jgi:thiol-disulfide isomerase/thioredoxin
MDTFYTGLIYFSVLGCIVAIIYFLMHCVLETDPLPKNGQLKDFDTDTVVFYYVDWCGYSIKAKPAWSAFAKKMNSSMVNGSPLSVISLNPEEQSMMPSGFSVKGYPTIVLFRKNKTPVKFTGAITEKNLTDFVNAA